MSVLHTIPPGLFCVPSALVAITGRDYESVIWPALNRHSHSLTLTGVVGGVHMHNAHKALEELGYAVRKFKETPEKPLRVQVRTWANRYPDRIMLLATKTHCLVAHGGRVFDNWHPHGPVGKDHTYSHHIVTWAAWVHPL